MKKLIIAAAIVCAAVMSQAASVKWRTSNVLDAAEKNKYSGSATLIATLANAGTVEDPVSGGSFGGTMSSGAINAAVDVSTLSVGASYDFYYTMTDSNGNVFTSTVQKNIAIQANSTPTINFGAGGAWAVPEPTSGLLLLLGVAGLALKRKRA